MNDKAPTPRDEVMESPQHTERRTGLRVIHTSAGIGILDVSQMRILRIPFEQEDPPATKSPV